MASQKWVKIEWAANEAAPHARWDAWENSLDAIEARVAFKMFFVKILMPFRVWFKVMTRRGNKRSKDKVLNELRSRNCHHRWHHACRRS